MRNIDINTLDKNLLADLDGDLNGWTAYEAEYPNATVSGQCYHIVFNDDARRGGIVFVGSGSSGHTEWTDASSAADVLARYEADEMAN